MFTITARRDTIRQEALKVRANERIETQIYIRTYILEGYNKNYLKAQQSTQIENSSIREYYRGNYLQKFAKPQRSYTCNKRYKPFQVVWCYFAKWLRLMRSVTALQLLLLTIIRKKTANKGNEPCCRALLLIGLLCTRCSSSNAFL